jgi:hypothetical protein
LATANLRSDSKEGKVNITAYLIFLALITKAFVLAKDTAAVSRMVPLPGKNLTREKH